MSEPAITLRIPSGAPALAGSPSGLQAGFAATREPAASGAPHRKSFWAYLALALAVIGAVIALSVLGASIAGSLRIDAIDSGSMTPAIPRGSDVFVAPEPLSALRVGQVIAFTPPPPYPQVTVVHEVVAIKRALGVAVVTTRGVANHVNDPWRAVVRGQVWHVIGSVGGLGYLTNFMRIGIVQLLVIILVVGTIFAGIGRLVTLIGRRGV